LLFRSSFFYTGRWRSK